MAPMLCVRRPSARRLLDLLCREGDDPSGAQAGSSIGGKFRFNANHLHPGLDKLGLDKPGLDKLRITRLGMTKLGIAELDGGRDAADQSAAADRDQHGFNVRQVFENFEANRALAGNDLFVIVGRHDRVTVLGGQLLSAQSALFAARADGDDLRSERGGSVKLVLWSVARHHDDGLHAQRPRRVGHALRVIAARIGNDSAAAFVVAKGCDLVISAAQFEGPNGLQVFELKEELALIRRARPFEQGSAEGDTLE